MPKLQYPKFGVISSLLLTFFLAISILGNAQTVSGKVTDVSKNPLVGVSISVKGVPSSGVTTTDDGSFKLNAIKPGAKIVFTSVGFATKEIDYTGNNSLTIVLEAEVNALNDVVVVGYGTQKKRDVTGSVSTIPKERLQQLPNTNIAQALQGSIPGLQVNTNGGGAEGNNLSILIRGRNSISASNSPLIIWDGIPYVGGISEINPNDIESIDVLKDASAAAIYGARGSNGVILITSKQGKKGRFVVTYDTHFGSQEIINKPRLLTPDEFYTFKTTRLNTSNVLSAAEQAIYTSKTGIDWYALATQTGTRAQHSLTVAGGNDKANYYVGATFADIKGVSVNDNFKRYSLRPSITLNLKPWLTFSSNSQLSFQDRNGLPVEFDDTRNTGGGANFFNPLTNPYTVPPFLINNTGVLAIYAYADYPQARNPLANTLVKNIDNSYRIFTTNSFKVDMPFLPGLSYRLNTGIEYESVNRKTYYGRNVALGYEKNGDAINYTSLDRNTTVENILNYTADFGKNNVNMTMLYSAQSEDFDRDEVEGTGFPNDVLTNYQMSSAALLTPSSYYFKQNLVSQMARLNYGYNGKYLLTLTARRDGYSAFGKGKKYGVFPSAAIAWNITQENFMKQLSFVNNLKLRVSYGTNGNQAVSSYSSLATLSSAPYQSGSNVYPGYIPNSLANGELSWESKKTLSFGLDYSLFKNRIQGTLDFYKSDTKDLLLERNISSVQGFTSVLQNIGKTANKGVELNITTTNIQKKDFKWSTSFNISYNENKIVDLYGDGKDDIGNKWFIGQPIRVAFGLQADGIFKSTADVTGSAQPTALPGHVRIKDIDKDGVINTGADRTLLGNLDPKFLYGITNNFSYKGFTLMVFFHGVGNVTKLNPLEQDDVFTDTKRNTTLKDWWSPTNPNGTHFANDANANKLNAQFYENASFARLKDISLAYNLPASLLEKMKVNSFKMYVSGRNLATYTKYRGVDPELSNQYGLPLQREVIFGLTIGL
jgi:TonB-linked SusC/RagA family outer membrane protein